MIGSGRARPASGCPVPLPKLLCCAVVLACLAACGPGGTPPRTAFSVQPVEFGGAEGSGQPHFATAPDGRPLMSWLEPDGDGYALRYARFESGAWGAATLVTSRDDLFINWADFPSVRPLGDDLWIAHWLALQPDSFGAYDAAVAVSRDGGITWAPAARLNEDETEAEHGFVETFVWPDGRGALWLDGRDLANWSFENPEALLGVSLRFAEIDADGTIVSRSVVDELVCDCCQPEVAISAGRPVVAYRDRTPDEIRDIAVRRLEGGEWSDAVGVGEDDWQIEGCPVNGPAIAASGSRLAVAWFTGAEGNARVELARSDDGGASFGPSVVIDADGAFGQVDLAVDADGTALVSWWRRAASGGIDLAVRSVGPDNSLGPIRVVGHNDVSQPIDVPQMTLTDGGLLIAWTTFDDGGAIRTVFAEGVR